MPAAPPPAVRVRTHRHVWLAAALLTALPLIVALSREMWEAPFPISETVAIIEVAGVMSDASGSTHAWPDPHAASYFDLRARSWYRPLFFATWTAFWHATHSIDATLLLFRLLEIGTTVLLIIGFLGVLRPRTLPDYAAAVVALSVFVGASGFRENLEIPMLMTLVGMLFALAAWALLEREHTRWHLPALVLLTALAVGYKEQGLVLVPVVVAAWWVRAPGARLGTAVVVTVLTLAYLGLRFGTSESWKAFEQDIAIGFETIPAAEAEARFGAFPYGIYAYNAAATVGNILFAEPRDGAFGFVSGIVHRTLTLRTALQVVTTTVMTVLLAWWAVGIWRREPRGTWSPESRLAVALVMAVAASGALGFSYPRERLAGMAVVFYGLASYYAVRAAVSRAAGLGDLPFRAAAVALLLLAAGWQIRTIDTVGAVYTWSRQSTREWIADRREIRLEHAGQEMYLRIFDALEPQGVAPIRRHSYPFASWADTPVWPQ